MKKRKRTTWENSRPKRQRQDRNSRRESRIAKKGFVVGYLETVAEDMRTNPIKDQVLYRDLCRVNLALAMEEIKLCLCGYAPKRDDHECDCTTLFLNKSFASEPSNNWTVLRTYARERFGRDGIRTSYGLFSPDPKRGPTSLFKKYADSPLGEIKMIAQDFVEESLEVERAKVQMALADGALGDFLPRVLCEEVSAYWTPDDRLLFWGLYVRKFMASRPQDLDQETRDLVEAAIVRTSFLLLGSFL